MSCELFTIFFWFNWTDKDFNGKSLLFKVFFLSSFRFIPKVVLIGMLTRLWVQWIIFWVSNWFPGIKALIPAAKLIIIWRTMIYNLCYSARGRYFHILNGITGTIYLFLNLLRINLATFVWNWVHCCRFIFLIICL